MFFKNYRASSLVGHFFGWRVIIYIPSKVNDELFRGRYFEYQTYFNFIYIKDCLKLLFATEQSICIPRYDFYCAYYFNFSQLMRNLLSHFPRVFSLLSWYSNKNLHLGNFVKFQLQLSLTCLSICQHRRNRAKVFLLFLLLFLSRSVFSC